jgi:hypothetical protein
MPLNTLKNSDIVADAIVGEWSDYEDARRKHSQALFGHPGAHVANLPMPTPSTIAAAILAALDKAGVA